MTTISKLLAEVERLYDETTTDEQYWAAVEAAQQELDRLANGVAVAVKDEGNELAVTLEYEGRQIKGWLPEGADIKVEPSWDRCFLGLFLVNGEKSVSELEITWLLGMGKGSAEIACDRLTVPEALVRRVQEAVCAASSAGQA
jgi:hypothetical protein